MMPSSGKEGGIFLVAPPIVISQCSVTLCCFFAEPSRKNRGREHEWRQGSF
jgi:hypothetical protein